MATIVQRLGKSGQSGYRVQVRRKGAPPQSGSFQTLAEARKWAKICEGAVLEGRHFTTAEVKRHTLVDLIDRYLTGVLLHKSAESARKQTQQFLFFRCSNVTTDVKHFVDEPAG